MAIPPSLPRADSRISDAGGRTTQPFYDWFRRLQASLDAGTLSVEELAALVAQLATILGSTDGTPGTIPLPLVNTIRAGEGISVYPNGNLRDNDVYIEVVPDDTPVPPHPFGAHFTLGDALDGEPGPMGPKGDRGPPGPMGPGMAWPSDDGGEPWILTTPGTSKVLRAGEGGDSTTFLRGDGTWSNTLLGEGSPVSYGIEVYGGAGRLDVMRSGGTAASPTALTNGSNLFIFSMQGYDGTSFSEASTLQFVAAGNWSGTSHPTQVNVRTTAVGSTSISTRWVFTHDGHLIPSSDNSSNLGSSTLRVLGTYTRNLILGGSTESMGGGVGIAFVGNAVTVPTSNPTGGALWYVEGGASKARGSSGTITTFAAANPHCPDCGSDFVHEWDNTDRWGYLAVCMNCFADGKNSHTRERRAWDIKE